jgi:outer membrane protein OmpA-like peptidoglycan-associated protein
MKKLTLILIVHLSSLIFTQAQDLKTAVSKVQSMIKDVKLEKSTMGQKFEFSDQNPYEITLTTSEQGSKGKTEQTSYAVNLIFFDAGKIERNASKKQLEMTMKTADGIDVIAVTKDGTASKYIDELAFLVDNADEARELEKALKEMVSIAKSKWESTLKISTDYDGLLVFMQSNIKDYTAMGTTVTQSVKPDKTNKYLTKISTQRSDGKKTEQKDYAFSWGDLVENSLKIDISGKNVSVESKTVDNIKYISTTDSKSNEYESSLNIATATPYEAKVLIMALQKLISLARKDQQATLIKNSTKTLDALKLIGDFQTPSLQVNQTIEANCQCKYNRNSVEKGKSKEEKIVFNLGDLTDFKLKIEKDVATITANTIDKLPFVETTEKNERKFEKEVAFHLEDVEKTRLLLAQLPALANTCKQGIKPENFDWLVEKMKNAGVENLNQKLELIDPSNHSRWRLTATEMGGKKNKEEVFEFNVYDLEVLKADYKVEKQVLAIRVKTKSNEKLIKQITDGNPTFTSEILYKATNAEDAKKINATIHGIGNNYKLMTESKFSTNAIVFEVNSTTIKPESDEVLKTVAEILKNNASIKLKITGFTDSDGDDKKNLDLSKRRAAAIKDKLVKDYQIDAARLTSDGKGEADPIAKNDTPEGKAQNRRVEFEKM